MSDEHIAKSHNRTLLLYHLVFPAKYRRPVFTLEVEESLRLVCQDIERCYEIRFVEIGLEPDHVHFLVQGVPTMTVTRMVTIIKHNSKGNLQASSIYKERNIMGRKPVDQWILCKYGWAVCKQGDDSSIHPEPWEE